MCFLILLCIIVGIFCWVICCNLILSKTYTEKHIDMKNGWFKLQTKFSSIESFNILSHIFLTFISKATHYYILSRTGCFESSLVCFLSWSWAQRLDFWSMERNGMAGKRSIYWFQVIFLAQSLSMFWGCFCSWHSFDLPYYFGPIS